MQAYNDNKKDIDFSALLGKILLCRKDNGKEFVSMLVAIEGNELIFRTRNGKLLSNLASTIQYAAEV